MLSFFQKLFSEDFMPHGHCYLWQKEVLWLNVISDSMIAMAYFAIPIGLAYFLRKRESSKKDVHFAWMIMMFSAFILLCGSTHVVDVVTIWKPYYRFEGVVKALTAVVSVATAVSLIPLIPKALALPSRKELEDKNEELRSEVARRSLVEETLRLNTVALQRSNDELESFAYVASHDLKSPLRAIDNLASWIAEDSSGTLNEQSMKHLDLMRQRAKRMEKLLDSLLQYSRVGRKEDQAREVDVKQLIEDIIFMHNKQTGLVFEVAPDFPVLKAPKGALNRVFGNLIGNAVKYHDKREGRISVSWEVKGDFYEFAVTDNGPGIAEEYHERIFGMFQTLQPRDEVEGSGMGLALVKKTVERFGGTVSVLSQPGSGASFRFTWPRSSPNERTDG